MSSNSPLMRAEKQLHNVRTTLNKREARYVDARIEGMPPVPAARIAGWEDESVHRSLEQDVRIRTAIETTNKVQGMKRQLTRDDVLSGLKEATEMASTATELVAAWREIGKVIGAYEPKKFDISVSNRDQLRDLSDEELRSQYAGQVIEGEYSLVEFQDDEDDADIPVEPPRDDGPDSV